MNSGFLAGLIVDTVPHIRRDPVDWIEAGLNAKALNRGAWVSLRAMFPDLEIWRTHFGYTRLVHFFLNGLTLDDWGITDLAPYMTKEQRLELADWIVRPPPNVNVPAMRDLYTQLSS